MGMGLYVGILADYDPEDHRMDDDEDLGFIHDPKEQFAAINHILASRNLPAHQEPDSPPGGEWSVGLGRDEFMQFINFILEQANHEHTTQCEFDHLMHFAPERMVIPVRFQEVIDTGVSNMNRTLLVNMALAKLHLLWLRKKRLPFPFIISSYQLQEECREGARLLGLDPAEFPLLSAENAAEVWRRWIEIMNARNVESSRQEIASVCIKLYQATQQSIEKGAAIYCG